MHLALQPIFVRLLDYSKSRFSRNTMAMTRAVSYAREPVSQGLVTHGGAVTDTNRLQCLYSKDNNLPPVPITVQSDIPVLKLETNTS